VLVYEPVPEPSIVMPPAIVGFDPVPNATPRAVTADPPSEVISPPVIATVEVIPVTAVVVNTGSDVILLTVSELKDEKTEEHPGDEISTLY
jgi:hypothetical protein